MKYLLLLISLFLFGCNPNRVPKDAKMVEYGSKTGKSSINNQLTGNSEGFSAANFVLSMPGSWAEEAPSNNMRIKQYRLKDYPDYEVVVSYFGNFDNMVDANIQRWKDQFTVIDKYEEPTLETNGVTLVKIIGTFKFKPTPMADDFIETPGYGTLAAIVASDEGPYFLRLNAPSNIINEQEKTFIEVLNSYRTF